MELKHGETEVITFMRLDRKTKIVYKRNRMKAGIRSLEWDTYAKSNFSEVFDLAKRLEPIEILGFLDSQFEENDSIQKLEQCCFLYTEIFRQRFGFDISFSGDAIARRLILKKDNCCCVDPLAPIYEAFESKTVLAEEDFFRRSLIRCLMYICDHFQGLGKYPEIDSVFETLLLDESFEKIQSSSMRCLLEEESIMSDEICPIKLRRTKNLPLEVIEIVSNVSESVNI